MKLKGLVPIALITGVVWLFAGKKAVALVPTPIPTPTPMPTPTPTPPPVPPYNPPAPTLVPPPPALLYLGKYPYLPPDPTVPPGLPTGWLGLPPNVMSYSEQARIASLMASEAVM